MIEVKFAKLHPEAVLPKRWSDEAVGYDIHAHILSEHGRPSKKLAPPCSTVNIPTGLAVEPPPGHFLFVIPRSGLGKYSVSVTNSPGLIDPDYRGEIMVLLYNGSYVNFYVEHGMRVAQLVVLPAVAAVMQEVELEELSRTNRGIQGFGSTGT
jgi:dUTP pyrophosphatase